MAVPSAQIGLTSLFGMGRGEPYCYNHLKNLVGSHSDQFAGLLRTVALYFQLSVLVECGC